MLPINGFNEKTISCFIAHLEDFRIFYNTLPQRDNGTVNEVQIDTKAISDKFKDRIFCVSGFRPDKELKHYIITNGGVVETTIHKNTTDLLIKEKPNKPTGKMKKAIERGIRVLYLKDL